SWSYVLSLHDALPISIVEQPLLGPLLASLGIERGRVVADQHHLDALQAHDAIGLRPAAVVAHRHAKDAAERTPDVETEITGLEVDRKSTRLNSSHQII